MQAGVIFICFFGVYIDFGSSQNPEVSTSSGVVIGTTHHDVHSFYSVRYGQAPEGNLRFEPPELAEYSDEKLNVSVPIYRRCWESSLDCDDNTGECTNNYSEDCLFLDINVPVEVDLSAEIVSSALPVMVWIHGGAFSFGSSTEPKYDGRYLSNNTNAIVVSINYRLDALGCLVFEDESVSYTGNQGIKDQQLALQWIHQNIANFGGNNSQITIFGESAGGQSVTMHLMSSKSRSFFQQAIIQSYRAALTYETKEQAKKKTKALLLALNCREELQCLRNATPINLMRAHDFVVENASENFFDRTQPYRPILDGEEFKEPPLKYFQTAKISDPSLHIIIGTTSDEAASIKVEFKDEVLTKERFIEENIYYAGPYYGPLAAQEYMKYADDPDDPNFDFTDILAQEVADMMFVCPIRKLSRLFLEAIEFPHADSPVYHYVFNDPVTADNCEEILNFEAPTQCNYASHAAELYYVFNSGPTTGLRLTPEAQDLADLMNEMWGRFAYHGKPSFDIKFWHQYVEIVLYINGTDLLYTVALPSLNMTTSGSNQVMEYRREVCDYWDSLGFYLDFPSSTDSPEEMTTSGIERVFQFFNLFLLLFVMYICVVILL